MTTASSSVTRRPGGVTVTFGDSATGTQSAVIAGRRVSDMLLADGFRPAKRWNHGTKELGVVAWKQRWERIEDRKLERVFTSYRKQPDVPVPLLNAVKVAKAEEVWLSESHSDADALCAAGVVGTTNWGGAHSWNDEDAAQLVGKKVVIVRHRDRAGHKFAEAVIASLPGDEITVVESLVGSDARDHLEASHGLDDFVEVV